MNEAKLIEDKESWWPSYSTRHRILPINTDVEANESDEGDGDNSEEDKTEM